MAKRKQRTTDKLKPAGSRVRRGFRRWIDWLVHTGKLTALLLAALAALSIYNALNSPRYRVRVVEAIGGHALSSKDVADLAAVTGWPIWFVETDEVVRRVSLSPYVERAEAHLFLPDRLEITVAERRPEVRWLHQGTAYAVTWNGLIIDEVPEASVAADAPVTTETLSATIALTPSTELTTTTGEAPAVEGPAPDDDGDSLANILTIVDTTPNRPLNVGDHVDADALELARRVVLRAPDEVPAPIRRIEWDGGLGVSLIVGDGRQVVLGRSEDLDRKLATLRYLLNDNTAFKYLDLRPSTPYYR